MPTRSRALPFALVPLLASLSACAGYRPPAPIQPDVGPNLGLEHATARLATAGDRACLITEEADLDCWGWGPSLDVMQQELDDVDGLVHAVALHWDLNHVLLANSEIRARASPEPSARAHAGPARSRTFASCG